MLLHKASFCSIIVWLASIFYVSKPAAGAAVISHNAVHETTSTEVRLTEDVCGVPPIKPDIGDSIENIVGGKEAIPHSWPWQIELQYDGDFICGGSVLAKRWIVTAAHCLTHEDDGHLRTTNMAVIVGEHDRTEPEPMKIEIKAKSIHPHPKFSYKTAENDIGLIELETEIPFNEYIQPVCLPTTDFKEGTMCVTTGWGSNQPGRAWKHWLGRGFLGVNHIPVKLQEVAIPIFSQSECTKDYQQPGFHIHDCMICAGYAEGGKSTCQGDSGGPLVCHGADGVWQLVGITSWGMGCAEPNYPSVFTRVRVFNDWIKSIMQPGNN